MKKKNIMKKFKCIIGLLSCAAILTACGTKTDNVKSTSSTKAKTSQTSSSTKPSSSTETQSSSSEEPQKSDEELYADIIASYPNEYRVGKHTFYDIDGNGTDEMIVGNGSFAYALYYLENGVPTELVSSNVSSVGGVRQGFSIYKNGQVSYMDISSFNREGTITDYQLKSDNTGVDIIKELDYKIGETADDGLQDVETLDYSTLTWQSAFDAADAQMDINAIQNKDYSSIAGTWQNTKGGVLTFNANGIVGDNLTVDPFNNATVENGILSTSVSAAPTGSYMIKFAPQGTFFVTDTLENEVSDVSKDRIWTGQQYNYTDPSAFYYKVD